jgi:uncharacterized protein YjbJ (UPF0337 family)
MHAKESAMNWSTIESNWIDYKATARQQWQKISDEIIAGTAGKRDRLSAQVQQAYAVNNEEAQRQISAWQSRQVEKPVAKQL